MQPLTMPKDDTFPFELGDDGLVYRFNLRKYAWELLKGTKKADGYYAVGWTIPYHGKRMGFIHRIVWIANNGPIPNGYEVDHVDMDKGNNAIENLRLVSHGDNIRAARTKLGNWSPCKLKPHQRALAAVLPPNANWGALAERWGVQKVTLLNARCQARKGRTT